MVTNNNRLDYIDTAKALAIFFVVMGHVLSGCKSDCMESWDEMIVWRLIYSFHMPLFMFVSGFVCFNPDKKYYVRDFIKRLVSYLIPFFTIALFLGILREKLNFNQLWYFRSLALFVLFLYIGMKAIDKCNTINPIVRVLLVVLVFSVELFLVYFLCQRLPVFDSIIDSSHINLCVFFVGGYIIRCFWRAINKFFINDYTLVFSLITIILLYNILPISTIVKQFAVILFIFNLSALMPLRTNLVLQNLGKNTQSVYILHFFILFNAPFVGAVFCHYNSMAMIWQAIPQLIWSVPVTIITIMLCLRLSTIIKCSPLLSLLILGDTKIIQTKIKVK